MYKHSQLRNVSGDESLLQPQTLEALRAALQLQQHLQNMDFNPDLDVDPTDWEYEEKAELVIRLMHKKKPGKKHKYKAHLDDPGNRHSKNRAEIIKAYNIIRSMDADEQNRFMDEHPYVFESIFYNLTLEDLYDPGAGFVVGLELSTETTIDLYGNSIYVHPILEVLRNPIYQDEENHELFFLAVEMCRQVVLYDYDTELERKAKIDFQNEVMQLLNASKFYVPPHKM